MTRQNQSSKTLFSGFSTDLILVIASIFVVAIATLYPLLEAFLIRENGKGFSILNLGLGIFFTACVTLLFKARMMLAEGSRESRRS